MTVAEAAARAGISESLVYAWVAEGTLPASRFGRRGKRGAIRIATEDLDRVLAGFKVAGPKGAPLRLKHVEAD